MAALDRAAIAAVDSTAQAADILELPGHLRDALWRVDSAAIPPANAPGGVVVAGMGGSAVGGRLAAAALGARLRRPFAVADGYALPPWIGPDHLVLCASYSGGTEETLSCYDDATERGAQRLVATTGGALAERARRDGVPVIPVPGGFQPRAAVGYGLVAALEAAALGGAAPSVRGEVEAAAALAAQLVQDWGPDAPDDSDAKALARALDGTIPVIVGAELTGPVAYRWKCQLNENSKVVAFASELPEADHNEVVPWPTAGGAGRFAAVFLEDLDGHPRNAARAELTAGLAARGAEVVERIAGRGETRLERLVSLVLLGDLVSLYLAVLRRVDPVDIGPISELKAALAAR
jgi:glucose/mannose-6-phosphate isomerase